MTKNQFNQKLAVATRILNAQIKQQIIDVKAVRTGRMKNNTKVKITFDFIKDKFTITTVNSTFYYKFVDKGTRFIAPRNITEKTLKRPKSVKALDSILDSYTDYLIDEQFRLNGI
jgi:hypothetical protein